MKGYNPKHVPGYQVPLFEILDSNLKAAALKNPDNPENPLEFKYTRSSLIHNAVRKFAILMAYHVHDKKMHKLKRLRDFNFCPLVGDAYQYGNALYRRNDIDRSHIRDNFATQFEPGFEAKADQRESFYWTNMYPMSNKVHHTVWGKMNQVATKNIGRGKVGPHALANVYKGIIFREDDGYYERGGIAYQIPTGFWQSWFYVKNERPCFVCYLLEDDPGYYQQVKTNVSKDPEVYLIKAAELEALTGMSFQGLTEFDRFQQKGVSTSSTRYKMNNASDLVF